MTDKIEEVVTDPIEDVVEDAPLPDHDIRPPWVDEVLEAVQAIPDAIKEALPAPVPDIADATNPDPDAAPDGSDPEPEPDASPVPTPWTHKTWFK